MKKIHLYISLITSMLTACSAENIITPEIQPEDDSAILQVRLKSQTKASSYVPFDANDKIRLYFAYGDLPNVPWWHQGVYTFPKDGIIDTEWNITKEEGESKNTSIYQKHITKGNDGAQYFFTATSLPEPFVSNENDRYQVAANQKDTSKIKSSDFLIARTVCFNDNWKKEGLRVHFRHVLSQLVVKVILPKGSVNDGFWENPKGATSSATINDRQLDYKVTYNKEKGDGAILDINKNTEEKIISSIEMYKRKEVKDTVTTNGGEAAYHTFQVILPDQSMQKNGEKPLLSFVINNKKFSYSPPDINTIMLAQEKVTTVILTRTSRNQTGLLFYLFFRSEPLHLLHNSYIYVLSISMSQ